jgi:hypothetical protein
MAEVVILSRDALEEIVGNLGSVTLVRAGNERADENAPFGDLRYPAEVTDFIWQAAEAWFRKRLSGPPVILPQPPEADNEIAALTVIVDRLEHLQPPTVQRVIRYLCDRYGTDGA